MTSAWSFGRDRRLLGDLVEAFEHHRFRVHDAWGDPDMNRSEISMSGPDRNLILAMCEACRAALPRIDLNRQVGTFPRLGALDLVRIEALSVEAAAYGVGKTLAGVLSRRLDMQAVYDGPHAPAGTENQILYLRRVGFGGVSALAENPLSTAPPPHPQWGVTVIEVGPRTTRAWLDLEDPECRAAAEVAATLDVLASADEVLLGVRADGVPIPSRNGSRVLLRFELPEQSDFDAILRVAQREARKVGATPGKAYARGLWLSSEARRAGSMIFGPGQIQAESHD